MNRDSSMILQFVVSGILRAELFIPVISLAEYEIFSMSQKTYDNVICVSVDEIIRIVLHYTSQKMLYATSWISLQLI